MPRKKKAKPATRGERVQMRLCDCRLVDVRENEDWAREAAVIERAMKRVERAERKRCAMVVTVAKYSCKRLDWAWKWIVHLERAAKGGV